MAVLVCLLLGAVPAPDPAGTATQDERDSRQAIQRRLQAIAADLDGASAFRDTVRQSARILARTEPPFQSLFFAPPAAEVANFRDKIATVQKHAGLIQFRLQSLLDDLAVVAAARAGEDPRWRAYHDYVAARICIEIDQVYSYNALLGRMRKELLQSGDAVGWRLVLVKEAGPDRDRVRTRARLYLQHLIDENPGTFWEQVARQDMAALAYRWQWETIGR